MDTKTSGQPTLVVQSRLESQEGAALKVVSFRLSEAGVRALSVKSDETLNRIGSADLRRTRAAA